MMEEEKSREDGKSGRPEEKTRGNTQEAVRLQAMNDESNSSGEAIADSELKSAIIHPKPDIENMETHAHELHKAPGHGWKHYFFEFFMLFIAVTLGFFVENQREHYIEHQREKKYASLLFEDLKKDTVQLNDIIDLKIWRAKKLDSLLLLLTYPDLQKQSTKLYYYGNFATLNLPFKPDDATIQQLRSSGSLRYFNNPQLYNAITSYYSTCSFYLDREGNTSNQLPVNISAKLFDAKEVASLLSVTPSIKDAVKFPVKEITLLTTDKTVINEFHYYALNTKLSNDVTLMLLKYLIKPKLSKLIDDLKKEYHLQ